MSVYINFGNSKINKLHGVCVYDEIQKYPEQNIQKLEIDHWIVNYAILPNNR